MNPLLKIAYEAGCQRCLSDFGLVKEARLSDRAFGALLGAGGGAATGALSPYLYNNGPFWDKDERALRGALVGGAIGGLGGWGVESLIKKFPKLKPDTGDWDSMELAGTAIMAPGVAAGFLASRD